MPAWLVSPGATVFERKYVRNKQDPLVEEVQLLEANPRFSRVLFPDRRESSLSTPDLAPSGQQAIALDQKHDESDSCPELPLPSQQTESVAPDGGGSPEIEHTATCFSDHLTESSFSDPPVRQSTPSPPPFLSRETTTAALRQLHLRLNCVFCASADVVRKETLCILFIFMSKNHPGRL